jgi:predicted alpha-1,6-mannanase (GH76 family)
LERETELALNVLFSVPITKTSRLFLSFRYSLFTVRIEEAHKYTAWKNSHIFKSEQLVDTMMTACESFTMIVDIPDRHTGAFATEITNLCHRLTIHLFKILRR